MAWTWSKQSVLGRDWTDYERSKNDPELINVKAKRRGFIKWFQLCFSVCLNFPVVKSECLSHRLWEDIYHIHIWTGYKNHHTSVRNTKNPAEEWPEAVRSESQRGMQNRWPANAKTVHLTGDHGNARWSRLAARSGSKDLKTLAGRLGHQRRGHKQVSLPYDTPKLGEVWNTKPHLRLSTPHKGVSLKKTFVERMQEVIINGHWGRKQTLRVRW